MSRTLRLSTLGAVILVALMVLSLLLGSRTIPLGEVVQAILAGPAAVEGTGTEHVVWNLRVPRTVLAVAVGASLGMAGAFAQAWTRNPLADPGFIGVTSGAAFAVALGMFLGWGALGGRITLALVGAALASFIVLMVSRVSLDPLTVILVGVGVSAALQAVTTALALSSRGVLDGMRQWTVGSTMGRGGEDIAVAWGGLLLGGLLAALLARPMDLLSMGEEASTALGASPDRIRLGAVAVVVILAGTATAAVGPMVFVGFAAPHIVRTLLGPSLSTTLFPTALMGGGLALAADIIGRLIMRPGELEMSIVMAVVGAPMIVWAVRHYRSLGVGQ
ncbi:MULTISPECIES: iron ABC transporter permease [unclassified Corynebacterium]|uniref:FecCD family ABC transporter permease n=1 Tax=unclassified Corynebacterium TaxID=2624378 RepID=UPI0029CA53C1|nr:MULTISPECIES: iron ABC transporter permease [unclassified Corynebacterium]WPF65666.1 iron ABC transporter permease [Corynebacterium sp. 22KM0430]WPF68162.1 iron ABC transporter permease [Corynebacterium sp. 21KM1197]